MADMVEHLPSRYEALSSNPSRRKTKQKGWGIAQVEVCLLSKYKTLVKSLELPKKPRIFISRHGKCNSPTR
jgi:hypothetical protein